MVRVAFSGCVALVGVTFLLTVRAFERNLYDVSDADSLAGRLVLMALRVRAADFSTEQRGRRVRVNDGEVLPADQAAQVLARMAKPMRCIAELRAGVLLVQCTRLTDAPLLSMHRLDRERATETLADQLKTFGIRRRTGFILVRSPSERMVITFEPLERFLKDYRVYHGLAFFPPDSEARAQGASVLMELRGSAGVEIVQ